LIYEFRYKEKNIIIFEIPATTYQPVRFFHEAYIRIGSITRKLDEFPEKEAKIWNKKTIKAFEHEIAKRNVTTDEIITAI
jgi:ATP-dependent DNA helicase RecG